MKRIKLITLLFVMLYANLAAMAQGDKPQLTKEEFRAKQKEFIIRKAELTKEEACKFFPLYFELQAKKNDNNEKIKLMIRETKRKSCDETDYRQVIDKMMDLRLETEKLDRCYISKYRAFLSDNKIFKILNAEIRFHKELLKSLKNDEKKPVEKKSAEKKNVEKKK